VKIGGSANKMKKTMAYAATAILLGFAIMRLPLALEAGQPTYGAKPQSLQPQSEESSMMRSYGLGKQPLNLLHSSFIFLSGLVAALGMYAILKKRII